MGVVNFRQLGILKKSFIALAIGMSNQQRRQRQFLLTLAFLILAVVGFDVYRVPNGISLDGESLNGRRISVLGIV
jgi:hypothetical protein